MEVWVWVTLRSRPQNWLRRAWAAAERRVVRGIAFVVGDVPLRVFLRVLQHAP